VCIAENIARWPTVTATTWSRCCSSNPTAKKLGSNASRTTVAHSRHSNGQQRVRGSGKKRQIGASQHRQRNTKGPKTFLQRFMIKVSYCNISCFKFCSLQNRFVFFRSIIIRPRPNTKVDGL